MNALCSSRTLTNGWQAHAETVGADLRSRASRQCSLLAVITQPIATKPAAFVSTKIVQPQDRQASVTLTGEVQARFRADLSFRVSGRVIARFVDVGTHVEPGEVLARLDPAEQQADVDAANAAVEAAEAQLRVTKVDL